MVAGIEDDALAVFVPIRCRQIGAVEHDLDPIFLNAQPDKLLLHRLLLHDDRIGLVVRLIAFRAFQLMAVQLVNGDDLRRPRGLLEPMKQHRRTVGI